MRHELTDLDVLTFLLAGCNTHEIATYAGMDETVAQAQIDHVLLRHKANAPKRPLEQLANVPLPAEAAP